MVDVFSNNKFYNSTNYKIIRDIIYLHLQNHSENEEDNFNKTGMLVAIAMLASSAKLMMEFSRHILVH